MKNRFLGEHLDEAKHKKEVMLGPFIAELGGLYYDKTVTNPWELRVNIAKGLTQPAQKKYFLTQTVLDGASKIKFEKIDLKWFNQIPDMRCIYIPGKDEFYRFNKINGRINILHFRKTSEVSLWYDCYSIILNDGFLALMPSQNKEFAERFIKLLLFIELGEITFHHLKPNEKVTYGKKGDEKAKNETGFQVTLVNSNWNKIIIVEGDIAVKGYFGIRWVGEGRKTFRLSWIREHTRSGYIRSAGRLSEEKRGYLSE